MRQRLGTAREIWRENVEEYCNSKSWLNDRYNDMRPYGNCKCATIWNEKKKSHCHKTKLKSQYGFILALSLSHSCSQCCKIRRLYSLPRLFHRLIRITHKYKQKCGIDAMILIQIDKIGEGLFRRHWHGNEKEKSETWNNKIDIDAIRSHKKKHRK